MCGHDPRFPAHCTGIIGGLNHLKIISFGPRPLNFLACNAPIQAVVQSGGRDRGELELDLFEAFHKHENDPRIPEVAADMAAELGDGNKKPDILPKLAQYELTLLDWIEEHKGYREFVAIAGNAGLHSRPSLVSYPAM